MGILLRGVLSTKGNKRYCGKVNSSDTSISKESDDCDENEIEEKIMPIKKIKLFSMNRGNRLGYR